jgi:hypothetical protein
MSIKKRGLPLYLFERRPALLNFMAMGAHIVGELTNPIAMIHGKKG